MFFIFLYVGGPGLHDPCEKEPIDTLSAMTDEESEAITYNGQVCTGMCVRACDLLARWLVGLQGMLKTIYFLNRQVKSLVIR